ncbi:MAG: hypothetical protein Q7S19_01310 [bacterium]|nr:hypothetical protein [bacterium]
MNLLPLEEKRAIVMEYRKRLVVVGLTLLIVLICVGMIPVTAVYMTSNYQIANLRQKVDFANKTNIGEGVVENLSVIEDTNSKLNLLARTPAGDLGYNLSELLSSVVTMNKARLTSWSYEQVDIKNGSVKDLGHRIVLGGVADDRDSLQSFVKILQADKRFSSVELPISSLIESKNIDFLITIMVNKK